MGDIEQAAYLESILRTLVKESSKSLEAFSFRNTTPEKKIKRFKQLFTTAGIDQGFYNDDGERLLEKIANMSEKTFIESTE